MNCALFNSSGKEDEKTAIAHINENTMFVP